MRDYLTLVTSESTGQPYDRVIRELSRNKWMDPKQAIEYGMIDKVGARCLGWTAYPYGLDPRCLPVLGLRVPEVHVRAHQRPVLGRLEDAS